MYTMINHPLTLTKTLTRTQKSVLIQEQLLPLILILIPHLAEVIESVKGLIMVLKLVTVCKNQQSA
jgi:hypothetical protein